MAGIPAPEEALPDDRKCSQMHFLLFSTQTSGSVYLSKKAIKIVKFVI